MWTVGRHSHHHFSTLTACCVADGLCKYAVRDKNSQLFFRVIIVVFVYSLKVGRGCTTELTHQGYQFFSSLFDRYDEVSFLHYKSLTYYW